MTFLVPPASVLSHAYMRFAALNVLALNAIVNASPVEHIAVACRVSPLVCLYEIVASILSHSAADTAAFTQETRRPAGLLPSLARSLCLCGGTLAAVLLITGPGYMPWTRVFAAIYALHIVVTSWLPPPSPILQAQRSRNIVQPVTAVWVTFSAAAHLLVCILVLSPGLSGHWTITIAGLALMTFLSRAISKNDVHLSQDRSPVGNAFVESVNAVLVSICVHQLPVIMSFFVFWNTSDMHELETKSVVSYIFVFDMAVLGLLIALAPWWPHNLAQTTVFVVCTWLIGMIAYNMSIAS